MMQFSDENITSAFQMISDVTGWSIFPTSDVSKAKVSLWVNNITAGELLERVVKLAGFVYHRQGNIISVMTYDEYMQHYGLSKEVIPLAYANATSVAAAIKPFMTKVGKSVVHNETQTLVLYEVEANLDTILTIIQELDTPTAQVIVEVITLQYAECESLADVLNSIFSDKDTGAKNKAAQVPPNASPNPVATDASKPDSAPASVAPYEPMRVFALAHANQLALVGTESDIAKAKELITVIDVPNENMVLEVHQLEYADAEVIAATLQELFANKQAGSIEATRPVAARTPSVPNSTEGAVNGSAALLSPETRVDIRAVGRTNQIIIKSYRAEIEKLMELVKRLDTFVEPLTRSYRLTYIDAAEVYSGIERIVSVYGRSDGYGSSRAGTSREGSGLRGSRDNGVVLVEKTNSILLTGPPSVHRIMTSIVDSIDQASTYETGLIRIYKIENADVEEVATTVRELIQEDTKETRSTEEARYADQTGDRAGPGPEGISTAETEAYIPEIEARVSINKSTNSVIVQATARQHRELEKLIAELDKKRKQVLIKAQIVEVTTSDGLDLGVELDYLANHALAFTSFGLSTFDPSAWTRGITVGPGGTAAVFGSDEVEAILHVLKSDGNARIVSMPQVLVNDNAVGIINGVAEVPTTQINASETVATTSFSGFVQAGTQFIITPHISESDYLRVEYQIELNSFGVKPTDPSIPPPRKTTNIRSEATVPDGYTIVVGGLQTIDESENVDKVPLLGDLPIVGFAFKNTMIKKDYKTTYLFITPTIMQDEDFSDLRSSTEKAWKQVQPGAKTDPLLEILTTRDDK
ncbi:MAG TPA: secretin N-terminal domain-containing protein [Anaerohalosphaeraceae bacterium]|nr:secretin N-terminal domain-containing protein [Anaerohalosphaeraceae bacterium]